MVKTFKCTNCKNVSIKSDKIIIVQCACGYISEQVDSKTHKKIIINYDNIDTSQTYNIQREDVVCTACGNTGNWTDLKDGFLTCECGHEQEDN